jgi:hypothetical protein
MPIRKILSPFKPGSRTPEEFRTAVKAAIDRREALTPPKVRVRLHSMEKRTIMEPLTRSPRREAIEAAVEKVAARREAKLTAEIASERSSGEKKPARDRKPSS